MQFQLFHDKCKQWAPIFMSTLNWQRHHVAGCFGNWGMESYGFTKLQEEHPSVPGSLGGINIGQWTGMNPQKGGRRYLFLKFAADNNFDPHDIDTGFKYGLHELTTTFKHAAGQVRKTQTIEAATYTFAVDYEMPGVIAEPTRESWANRADSAIGELTMVDQPTPPVPAPAPDPHAATNARLLAVETQLETLLNRFMGPYAAIAGAIEQKIVNPVLPTINQALDVQIESSKAATALLDGAALLIGFIASRFARPPAQTQ